MKTHKAHDISVWEAVSALRGLELTQPQADMLKEFIQSRVRLPHRHCETCAADFAQENKS